MSTGSSNGDVYVVTGERGAGKTTFCRVLVDEARSRRARFAVAGVLSPKVFLQGRESAIELVDVASGQHRLLATRRDEGDTREGPSTTIRWRFDVDALAWGETVLRSATPCDLLVVDEVGPLEFESGEGWIGGLAAVDSVAYGAAFVVVRSELVERALDRWPGARVIHIYAATDTEAVARRLVLGLFPRAGDR